MTAVRLVETRELSRDEWLEIRSQGNRRKVAQASGIIRTRSLGMKGTHIQIVDADRWAALVGDAS